MLLIYSQNGTSNIVHLQYMFNNRLLGNLLNQSYVHYTKVFPLYYIIYA